MFFSLDEIKQHLTYEQAQAINELLEFGVELE